jgi:hypothetical protein
MIDDCIQAVSSPHIRIEIRFALRGDPRNALANVFFSLRTTPQKNSVGCTVGIVRTGQFQCIAVIASASDVGLSESE